MNQANAPPKSGRRFYSIVPNDEGTVDVLLNPDTHPMATEDGVTDYSITALIVRCVDPEDPRFGGDLEAHIRANFTAWCDSGKPIEI